MPMRKRLNNDVHIWLNMQKLDNCNVDITLIKLYICFLLKDSYNISYYCQVHDIFFIF